MKIYVLGTEQFGKMQYPQSMIDQIVGFAYSPFFVLTGMLVTFLAAWTGCYVAAALLKKHFVKAGYIQFKG
ncbi:MptD family putative ECF transporter S component [Bacillus sp. Sa1BUA2]|uniref:MptD family putative ECF transporter S component n=1 Tax=Bacillus norwichensis TaxID=2762217 RepID=A0ABR8VQ31_9BACI|nr:MptD family putative ECF transporter S component [Bacillus norwichensis]